MNTFLRSIVVIATLLAGASAASATTYGYGYGWSGKASPTKHLSTRAFFEQLKKNQN